MENKYNSSIHPASWSVCKYLHEAIHVDSLLGSDAWHDGNNGITKHSMSKQSS